MTPKQRKAHGKAEKARHELEAIQEKERQGNDQNNEEINYAEDREFRMWYRYTLTRQSGS